VAFCLDEEVAQIPVNLSAERSMKRDNLLILRGPLVDEWPEAPRGDAETIATTERFLFFYTAVSLKSV
jgi:hypothetical protein